VTLGAAPAAGHDFFPQPGPPSPGPPVAKLAAKLVKVMGAIGHIPKRGRNDFFGYDYATEADVADAVRVALVAEGVVMIPSIVDVKEREVVTRQNKKEIVTTVTLHITFIDGDSGAMFSFRMAGAGQDGGDKGIMKAISAAVKYAQLKALSLPTGDDPEADAHTDRAQAQPTNGRPAEREPGSDDAPAPYRLRSPEPAPARDAAPPWQEAPWEDDMAPAPPVRPEPPRARERIPAPPPARDPNRPSPNDCISEGKHKRLEAIIAAKARDYEWDYEQLRAYVHRHLAQRYQIAHTTDIPWRGSTYQDICDWVEKLGAP
jgi:hypothetical protein